MRKLTLVTLLLLAALLIGASITSAQTTPDIEIVTATGYANSCRGDGAIANITVRYNIAGTVTLVGQAFTEVYNDEQAIGPTAGGGQEFNTNVGGPDLPDNTLVAFTFTNGDPDTKAGITVNCTTGVVGPGGALGPDGRLDAGNDLPVVVYPRLDRNGNRILDFYLAERENGYRGRRITRITNSTLAALPVNPEENLEVATIGNGLATLYLLTNGDFQLNFAPDFEGKVAVVVFNGVPPSIVRRADIE